MASAKVSSERVIAEAGHGGRRARRRRPQRYDRLHMLKGAAGRGRRWENGAPGKQGATVAGAPLPGGTEPCLRLVIVAAPVALPLQLQHGPHAGRPPPRRRRPPLALRAAAGGRARRAVSRHGRGGRYTKGLLRSGGKPAVLHCASTPRAHCTDLLPPPRRRRLREPAPLPSSSSSLDPSPESWP